MTGAYIRKWRRKGRKTWWYVVRKDTFIWQYWNEVVHQWTSFGTGATVYADLRTAELEAFEVAGRFPDLIGHITTHSRQ